MTKLEDPHKTASVADWAAAFTELRLGNTHSLYFSKIRPEGECLKVLGGRDSGGVNAVVDAFVYGDTAFQAELKKQETKYD